MKSVRTSLTGAVLLAGVAVAQPIPPKCFWTGAAWTCWTHPLFPDVTLAPDGNPYRAWAPNWGGPGWRFYGWLSI
jgi:hypothetical protein